MIEALQKIVAASALAFAFSGLAQAADLKIGLIVPMSGPFASHGKQITNGIKLYLAQNGDTIAGRKVQIILIVESVVEAFLRTAS